MKLTNKVPLLVGIPLILCFIVLGVVNYESSKNDSYSALNQSKKNTLDSTMMYINAYFAGKKTFIAELVEKFDEVDSKNDKGILNVLDLYYDVSGFKAGIFYVRASDGKIFQKVNKEEKANVLENTEYRNDSWYKEAVSEGRVIIGNEVFYNDALGKNAATIAAPVFENGKIVGVIAGDVLLEEMRENILSLKPSRTSSTFAFDSRKLFTIYADSKQELKPATIADEVTRKLQEISTSKNKSSEITPIEYNLNNIDQVAVCAYHNDLNWTICATSEAREFDESLGSLIK
ncbi:cache domain-containing protein, partial [Campylobacter sp. Cr9]|uniref:cache domain-containing protein n=1 Tax=Campylobacter sp. Cr9 TaxID=2735728 RepID=UPI003014716B|nr:cache domain-containing protein [Campylobacter sp. Cr9]